MDWLLARQERIEKRLAKRHLADGALVLYDLTSTYFEGNRAGPKTLTSQIEKLRERFALSRVVPVGERGMLSEARIREELRGADGLDWITALRAPAIEALAESGSLQRSLFDQRDLAEITDPRYPGERLVVCKNPLLAEERRRKREELLKRTDRELAKVALATLRPRRRLRGKEKFALRVGKVLGRFKMGKHFRLLITEESFSYERNEASIGEEAALDGLYVLRTSVKSNELPAADVVRCYKRLASVERAFRSLKTVDLNVRPIHHRKAERVRAHVLLCMLAYYVEWHMRRARAPMLFDDDKEATEAARSSPVAPAVRSKRALKKAARKRTDRHTPLGELVYRRQLVGMGVQEMLRLKTAASKELEKSLKDHIDWLDGEIEKLECALSEHLHASQAWRVKDNLLLSIPGVGKVTAVTSVKTRRIRPGARAARSADQSSARRIRRCCNVSNDAGRASNVSPTGTRVVPTTNDASTLSAAKAPNCRTAGTSATSSEPNASAVVSERKKHGLVHDVLKAWSTIEVAGGLSYLMRLAAISGGRSASPVFTPACSALAVYRRPERSVLYRVMQGHLETWPARREAAELESGGAPAWVEGELR